MLGSCFYCDGDSVFVVSCPNGTQMDTRSVLESMEELLLDVLAAENSQWTVLHYILIHLAENWKCY